MERGWRTGNRQGKISSLQSQLNTHILKLFEILQQRELTVVSHDMSEIIICFLGVAMKNVRE
jgi:hypothetical protein